MQKSIFVVVEAKSVKNELNNVDSKSCETLKGDSNCLFAEGED